MRKRRLFVVAALAMGCGDKPASGASGGVASGSSSTAPTRELYKQACAAMPKDELPTCTEPVTKPLRLLCPKTTVATCEHDRFGTMEAWKRFRPGEGDWKEKKVLETDTLAIFEPTSEKVPVVGGVLIPGVVEGRVVVFDAGGKAKCQVKVRAEGPDRAWRSDEDPDGDAKRLLCGKLSAAVTKALASPGEGGAAPPSDTGAAPSATPTAEAAGD